MKKFRIILLITISVLLIASGITVQIIEINIYNEATISMKKLYKNKDVPRDNITDNDIINVENKIKKITPTEKRKQMQQTLNELKDYLNLKTTVNDLFCDNILRYDATNDELNKVLKNYDNLTEQYKIQLKPQIDSLKEQMTNISKTVLTINNLFQDNNHTTIRENLTRAELNNAKELFNQLPQKDNMQKEKDYLTIADKQLTKKEEEQKLQQIKNAWIILDVPYISQNLNKVYNGCEAASLLMGLKYKGYLQNMDIVTYANKIPKTDNPHTGFYRSIFDVEPTNLPHWIAPGPLAQYGRATSGNNNIFDITGSTLEQLDKELENNNPVIIYATAMFKSPKNWIEEVPNNLHVMLLTGYNKITGEQIITDPWTYASGRKKWQLSKNELETVYNQVGKKAVVIR